MTEESYSIGKIAALSGVSLRTLRFYDECGLLCPKRLENGYRSYSDEDVDKLQCILLYRELDIPVIDIQQMMQTPTDRIEMLREQRKRMKVKRNRLNKIIHMVDSVIDHEEKGNAMSAKDKLDPFVKEQLEKNDERYGEEMRATFGDERFDRRYDSLSNLDKKGFEKLNAGFDEMHKRMAHCMRQGNTPDSEAAQELIGEHHAYLGKFGDFYTVEVYRQLGASYSADARFRAHYEAIAPGFATWLSSAIEVYCQTRC
jgi:DNA-binding transcriptional MerR regulator